MELRVKLMASVRDLKAGTIGTMEFNGLEEMRHKVIFNNKPYLLPFDILCVLDYGESPQIQDAVRKVWLKEALEQAIVVVFEKDRNLCFSFYEVFFLDKNKNEVVVKKCANLYDTAYELCKELKIPYIVSSEIPLQKAEIIETNYWELGIKSFYQNFLDLEKDIYGRIISQFFV